MKIVGLLIVSLSLYGCAAERQGVSIREADEAMVEGCEYLGDVDGTSGWGNIAASTGIENAKKEAMQKAAALGATHVVWRQVSGGYSPYVSGRAYRCKAAHTVAGLEQAQR